MCVCCWGQSGSASLFKSGIGLDLHANYYQSHRFVSLSLSHTHTHTHTNTHTHTLVAGVVENPSAGNVVIPRLIDTPDGGRYRWGRNLVPYPHSNVCLRHSLACMWSTLSRAVLAKTDQPPFDVEHTLLDKAFCIRATTNKEPVHV